MIDDRWPGLAVGDVVPDYGGKHETFTVAAIDAPPSIGFRSRRPGGTRVCLRLRLAPVKHAGVANTAGDFFAALTIAGLAAGLRERLSHV